MHGEEPNSTNDPAAPGNPAEAKRRAARRRFLAKGTATGSGLLIVTLYHQRGFGKNSHPKKVIVSSPEKCLSLGGAPGKKSDFKDSVTGKKIKGVECDNLPG